MKVSPRGTFHGDAARLGVACPKEETSGPCRGAVKLLHPRTHELLARGTFRVAAGRRAKVKLEGRGLPETRRRIAALARVRGADLLDNTARVQRTVKLRRGR
jgi:hypothetical protein